MGPQDPYAFASQSFSYSYGSDLLDLTGGFHVFMVVRYAYTIQTPDLALLESWSTPSFAEMQLAAQSSTQNGIGLSVTDGVLTYGAQTPGFYSPSNEAFSDGTAYILEWSYEPSTLRLGGTDITPSGSGPGPLGTPVGYVRFGMVGLLYEIKVYNTVLTGANLTTARSVLASKYGLSA